ncbi:MAG: hypothetical protein AAF086_07255 [Planctomycetota bacterium]
MKLPLVSRPPRPRRAGRLVLLAAAALSLPLLMPPGTASTAAAGETRWSVTVGSGHSNHHYERRSSRHHGHYSHSPRHRYPSHYDRGGYTKQVWVPPVYRTRYDDCGRAFRVCVRQGYYKQVYVSAPRYRDYSRRGQWGNSGSCRY